MENSHLPHAKHVKPLSEHELISAKPVLSPKIPRQAFLRIDRQTATRKSNLIPDRIFYGTFTTGKDFWKYLHYLTKVHKWKLFKEMELKDYKIVDVHPNYPNYSQQFPIKTIKAFPHLKRLSISFTDDKKMTNEYLESLLIEVCHNLQLESFSFKITRCEQITNDTLKAILVQIVHHQPGLKELTFQTQTNPRLDDKGLEFIAYKIGRYMADLRSLNLYFNETIYHNALKSNELLAEAKAFAVSNKSPISDKGLKAIALNIGKNLGSLKHFGIKIDWVKGITDKGVKTFVVELSKDLSHLKSINLSFQDCKSLTGSGMKSLTNELCKRFKDLRRVWLSFDKCEVFPNDVKSVMNKIQKEMPQLEIFFLNNTRINKIF